jgi:hypothetical protein
LTLDRMFFSSFRLWMQDFSDVPQNTPRCNNPEDLHLRYIQIAKQTTNPAAFCLVNTSIDRYWQCIRAVVFTQEVVNYGQSDSL